MVALGCGSISQQSGGNKTPGVQPQTSTSTSTGTGGAPSGDGAAGHQIFASESDLPDCDEGRDGALVYVSATRSFRACSDGEWSEIDLKGEKGEPGEKGEAGSGASETVAAIELYKKYRTSIFRVTLSCTRTTPVIAECQDRPATATLLGSAFLCGAGEVCTNQHVALCPECFTLAELQLQGVEGSSDSVNSDGAPATPFFKTTSGAAFKLHQSYDLVKIPVDTPPAGAEPIPLATEAFTTSVETLDPILSLSFALGFQDLYVDVGYVNTKDIGECSDEGGTSGYGCPSKLYDFSTSNDTDHGSSGSPLIDVASGKVVGVTTAGTEGENANFTWAIDASRFKDID
jgi:hypothetical protein